MKLILERVPEGKELWQHYNIGSSPTKVLLMWLRLYDIWIDEKAVLNIEYNTLYHFYNWSLYYIDEKTKVEIDKVAPLLRENGYEVEQHGTWSYFDGNDRHCGGCSPLSRRVNGIQIWIRMPKKEGKYENPI